MVKKILDKIDNYKPLILKNKKGDVLRMIKKKDKLFFNIAEVYFSEIKSNKIKAWKKHKYKMQLITVPVGLVKIVMYDEKKYKNKISEVILGRKQHMILKIPPKVWYGFKSLSKNLSLIVNCTNKIHSDKDSLSLKFDSKAIPYKW
jgi:dTDP-4-dehydrorhamnose 3,5-epimerase